MHTLSKELMLYGKIQGATLPLVHSYCFIFVKKKKAIWVLKIPETGKSVTCLPSPLSRSLAVFKGRTACISRLSLSSPHWKQ